MRPINLEVILNCPILRFSLVKERAFDTSNLNQSIKWRIYALIFFFSLTHLPITFYRPRSSMKRLACPRIANLCFSRIWSDRAIRTAVLSGIVCWTHAQHRSLRCASSIQNTTVSLRSSIMPSSVRKAPRCWSHSPTICTICPLWKAISYQDTSLRVAKRTTSTMAFRIFCTKVTKGLNTVYYILFNKQCLCWTGQQSNDSNSTPFRVHIQI